VAGTRRRELEVVGWVDGGTYCRERPTVVEQQEWRFMELRRRSMTLVAVALCISYLAFSGPPRSDGETGADAGDPREHAPRATRLAQRLRPLPQAIAALQMSATRSAKLRPAELHRTTGGPGVALTFDDGPDPYWTPRFLELLRRYRVKATFCVLGYRAGAYPELVRQIVREGHTLCNHTMRHDLHLRERSPQHVAADLQQANALIAAASGVTPRYFRAPGGNWSPMIVATARQLGMAPLHWAVDPQDWRRPPPYRIVLNVRKNTRPGSILLHDGGGDRAGTYTALVQLLPELRRRFKLVPL
jgi:peptidoglycan/xylan/chitin deacetylase (PgdA/CDA1 family)